MTSSQSHIPGGHDLVARRCSKRREFCSLTMILEDDSARTRAWTWSWMVISDLFPVEHVQTPGGQASLETWDGLTLATKPPSCWDILSDVLSAVFKVHLTPIFFSAEMKLCNIHIKNLIILSVSGIFKGFKNWQKVAEICYQLVHDRASRGLALFLIWRYRLIYMALTLCKHACKTVFDVKSGIDPCPSPARSWDKAYQISGCTVARKKFRCFEKKLNCFWNSFKFAFLRR